VQRAFGHELFEQTETPVAIELPQLTRLRHGQPQAGHFAVFTAHACQQHLL
jgi:hypothetical protein